MARQADRQASSSGRAIEPELCNALDAEEMMQYYACDNEAFNRLAERHRALLEWNGLQQHLQVVDAEDIYQDTLIKVSQTKFNPGTRYDPRTGPFHSWLKTIFRNCLRDFLRRRLGRREIVGIDGENGNDDFLGSLHVGLSEEGERADSLILYLDLAELIARLPERQRQCFTKYYFESKTQQEIANEMCCAVGTVCHDLELARQTLSAWMTRAGY